MKQNEVQPGTAIARRPAREEFGHRGVPALIDSGRGTYSEVEPENESSSLGFHDYLGMVRDRLWLVVLLAVVITSLAIIYEGKQPDVFEAEANIQLDLENNPALGTSKDTSVIISQADDPSYFNTQLKLLKSPAFLRRVVKTMDLEHDKKFQARKGGGSVSNWKNFAKRLLGSNGPEEASSRPLREETIAPASSDGNLDEAQRLQPYVEVIGAGLEVKLAETTRLISIKYSHPDPETAARVANVIADTFVQANWERRGAANSSAGEFLQKRIAELQFKIGENEHRLIEYAKQHQVLPPDSGKDMEADRLAEMDKGLLEAENQRKFAESEYQAALAPGAAAALVEGAGNAQLAPLIQRLNELRQKREVMLLDAGENWPEVKELKKQIGDLELELKDARERAIAVVLTNLDTKYRQALAHEQALRKSFNEQHSVTLNQDEAAINYKMIQQETATYKGLLDNLLQRSKENDVVLAATPNNVHVTDYATMPVKLVGPTRLKVVGLALGASLSLGIGLAVFLGSIDDNVPVDSVERVEKLLGLPALAILPSSIQRRRLTGVRLLPGKQKNTYEKGLLINCDTRSAAAESYRKLRTSLLLSGNGNPPQCLLVASSLPSEGKTTATINLGLVMAQSGTRVLLLDADLRHPSLHHALGMSNERGLSTILTGEVNHVEALAMIERYQKTELYVLPSGPIPENPADLLGSPRMKQLLADLSSTFTHVIIDSPPVSYFTDAVVLSLMVDGVLMVVRGPKCSGPAARISVQELDAVNAPIVGVVLNDVTVQTNDYRYYRGYYQQHDGFRNRRRNSEVASSPEILDL